MSVQLLFLPHLNLPEIFNHYLEEAKRICPEHEGIQLLDPLNEKGCKMGQVLRASIALSEFLSECQTNANCSGPTREN